MPMFLCSGGSQCPSPSMVLLSRLIVPELNGSSPAMALSSVVFPQPLAPSTTAQNGQEAEPDRSDMARSASAKKAAKGSLLELTSYHAKKSVVSSSRPAAAAKEVNSQTARKALSGASPSGFGSVVASPAHSTVASTAPAAPTLRQVPALNRPPALPKLEKPEPGPTSK